MPRLPQLDQSLIEGIANLPKTEEHRFLILERNRGIGQRPSKLLDPAEGDGADRLLANRNDQVDRLIDVRDAASPRLLDLAAKLPKHLERHRMRLGRAKPCALNVSARPES